MKKAIRTSTRQYAKDLVKYSEKVAAKFDPDIIHSLRTTFKKLRALLRWQKANKKIYMQFKKIYDVVGEIRIVQVAKEMLKKEKGVPPGFKVWLTTKLAEKKKKWNNVYCKTVLNTLPNQFENLQIHPSANKKFFCKRIEQIGALISAGPVSDTSLHDIRKMTKDMQYILEWEKNRYITKGLRKSISVRQLKDTGNQIGKFNDTRMLITLLVNYRKQENQKVAIDKINPLIKKWRQNKLIQKEKLINRLSEPGWRWAKTH